MHGRNVILKKCIIVRGNTLDHRMHNVVSGSNSTTQSNFGTSIMPRYCCSGRHRSVSIFHSWNQAFSIIDFFGRSPNINPTWCWEIHEGLHAWLYYVFPCIRCPGFVIVNTIFGGPFSVVFSNQRCSNCSSSMGVGLIMFCYHLCCSSSMVFRQNPLQSLSLSFGFRPLFLCCWCLPMICFFLHNLGNYCSGYFFFF